MARGALQSPLRIAVQGPQLHFGFGTAGMNFIRLDAGKKERHDCSKKGYEAKRLKARDFYVFLVMRS
jgi:hypothetical protein